MDSANSGSIQSCSGRDDNQDFDSISARHQLQFLPQNPNFFDSQNIPNDNHDLVWPRVTAVRSDPNFTFFGTLATSSTATHSSDPMAGVQAAFPGAPPSIDHGSRPPASQPSNNVAIKNPKKRTRASRRAPTTVLTTDVTNFRQMVQEFTGIPASPFSAGSPYSRSFDLFSAGSALRTGGNLSLHSLRPLYPPRPLPAAKLPSPFPSSNSIAIGNSPNDENAAMNAANYPSNYHLFNLQQQNQRNNIPLQLAANVPMNLGNFLNRETQQPMRAGNDGDGRRWKSGETVGRSINNDGGINDGNHHNVAGFDGRVPPAPAPATQQLSGYNLNVAEKAGMENAGGAAGDGRGGGGSGEGTVGSWICTSHN